MKADKRFNLVFMATLLIGIVLFGFIGATYAYFNVKKIVTGSFEIGKINGSWYNNGVCVESDSVINHFWLDGNLIRGNDAGRNIIAVKKNATTGEFEPDTNNDGSYKSGNLTFTVEDDSADCFVRFKPYAYVVLDDKGTVSTTDDEVVDVTEYLTFRYITGNSTIIFGNASIYGTDSEGWYYLYDIKTAGDSQILCNNVVLDSGFPTAQLSKDLYITFEFEALQSDNNPVLDIWGQEAYDAIFG